MMGWRLVIFRRSPFSATATSGRSQVVICAGTESLQTPRWREMDSNL